MSGTDWGGLFRALHMALKYLQEIQITGSRCIYQLRRPIAKGWLVYFRRCSEGG